MKRLINYYFLILSIVLIVLGLLFLATLSAPQSLQIFQNTNYYFFHQLISVAIGFVLCIVIFRIPLRFLKKITPILFFINLLLLVAVFLPFIGTEFWGASRWISIGKNTFQPSEFLKITAILYLSSWLSSKFSENTKSSWITIAKKGYYNLTRVFLPFLLLLATITILLYLQKDISTLGIIAATLIIIYFVAATPLWHTILAFIMGSISVALFIIIEPYRLQRFLTLLNPESDPLGKGLQIKQSLIAIGSGGIFGKGLGMSTQKFGFLPQAMSDSVFAILGEETGIIGSSILIILFLLFLYFGFKIANSATDKFSKLTAVGITTWIVLQAFTNIASSIGLIPLSGIPLPFFSYGGSHLIAEIIGVGLLLKISKSG